MALGERLLLSLSRPPGEPDYPSTGSAWSVDDALTLLVEEFPDFERLVTGRSIVDFGCGSGHQAAALVRRYDCRVLGLETNPRTRETAERLRRREGIPEDRLSFAAAVDVARHGTFDVVISQNSFEHFVEPDRVLAAMSGLLAPGGRALVTFGPPWFAPYGSHMHFFCRVPWLNLLFPERTVLRVRGRFRDDGATRYEEVESGLNRMTLRKFERLVRQSGLAITYRKLTPVKGLHALTGVPGLRELFTNRVSAILAKPSGAG